MKSTSTSRFCKEIDLNDTYRMMLTMMIMMIMETENGHISTKFEAPILGFCMVVDINDTYRMKMIRTIIKMIMNHFFLFLCIFKGAIYPLKYLKIML